MPCDSVHLSIKCEFKAPTESASNAYAKPDLFFAFIRGCFFYLVPAIQSQLGAAGFSDDELQSELTSSGADATAF
jgi:hypothetical protein